MRNLFFRRDADDLIARLRALTPDARPHWGTMTVAQMLAHSHKPFETVLDPTYAERHPRPNALVRALLRVFLKPVVAGPKPYRRNGRTAPEFIVDGSPDFEAARARLIEAIERAHALGAAHFEGRESHSFGPLTAAEWNTLFVKHLDHHLRQFGV
jgi:hypothetical protein